MLVLAQTEVEEGGVQVKNPLSRGGGNNSFRQAGFRGPPKNLKISGSGRFLNKRIIRIRTHQLILTIVLMTRATGVEEVSTGHAPVERKWWNNTKHTRPLFIQRRQMIWNTGIGIP